MAITLADAKLNTTDDIDLFVIDEFRKSSWLLDNLIFDPAVSPAGGGATLTYGYTRVKTERGAAFRAINSEYTASEAKRERFTTDLKPLGGKFQVDRVLSNLGPAVSNEVAFQLEQVVKAARAKFADEFINGDVAVDANGFDGLDKALVGSATEIIPGGSAKYVDWSGISTEAAAHSAIDLLDELVNALDGTASGILANTKALLKIKSIARRAGFYAQERNEFGQVVEFFAGVPMIDLGAKPESSDPIIPIESRDPDGAGAGGTITGLTDIYVTRLAADGVHAVTTSGTPLLQTWLPDFSTAGAVKQGEVEMGPVGMVVKATKSVAVLRNVKVQ